MWPFSYICCYFNVSIRLYVSHLPSDAGFVGCSPLHCDEPARCTALCSPLEGATTDPKRQGLSDEGWIWSCAHLKWSKNIQFRRFKLILSSVPLTSIVAYSITHNCQIFLQALEVIRNQKWLSNIELRRGKKASSSTSLLPWYNSHLFVKTEVWAFVQVSGLNPTRICFCLQLFRLRDINVVQRTCYWD